jgi:hypothetical protein
MRVLMVSSSLMLERAPYPGALMGRRLVRPPQSQASPRAPKGEFRRVSAGFEHAGGRALGATSFTTKLDKGTSLLGVGSTMTLSLSASSSSDNQGNTWDLAAHLQRLLRDQLIE